MLLCRERLNLRVDKELKIAAASSRMDYLWYGSLSRGTVGLGVYLQPTACTFFGHTSCILAIPNIGINLA